MRVRKMSGMVLGVIMLYAAMWALVRPAVAQGQRAPAQDGAAQQPATPDPYQRSFEIWSLKATATSGPQRGEEIYYYKCWFCHNQYDRTGPQLKDIFTRDKLVTGQPVSDQTIKDKILNGTPGVMPAYRSSLAEQDVADLIAYIKSNKCCFDAEEPPPNPRYRTANATKIIPTRKGPDRFKGGPRGTVRTTQGMPLEGMGVQLIDPQTAIRTTVRADADGRYEFPRMEAGTYTLRIARPLVYKPYVKESVQITAGTQLPEIVLDRVSNTGELVPPTPEILAQLTGVEWMLNLPGTAEEKRALQLTCHQCHTWQQIFRARYDEASWRVLVRKMQGSSPLIGTGRGPINPANAARNEIMTKFLARVRGPDSKDPNFQVLPWPQGIENRVVVTEYELPRELLATHDVHGDSMGRIWYTPHRSPYSGMLDPKTGKVTEYRIPATRAEDTQGALPGTHRVWVDKKDVVWWSEQWDHFLTGQDAKTGKIIKRFPLGSMYTLNSSGFSNFAMDDESNAYETNDRGELIKIDTRTGEVKAYKFPKQIRGVYDSTITPDGRYWVGAQGNLMGLWDFKTGEYWEAPTRNPVLNIRRGGFDPDGNAWYGAGMGVIVKLDTKAKRLTEYHPPVQYASFYEVLPDGNGEIWAAALHSGKYLRFNPKTDKWIAYPMPEPYSHNRRAWIDNSTTPVTLWYVDHNGYIVRIEPLD
jgi:streptogramin lyase/cytochrome c5